VKRLVHQYCDLEIDSLPHRQPVKLPQYRCDVVSPQCNTSLPIQTKPKPQFLEEPNQNCKKTILHPLAEVEMKQVIRRLVSKRKSKFTHYLPAQKAATLSRKWNRTTSFDRLTKYVCPSHEHATTSSVPSPCGKPSTLSTGIHKHLPIFVSDDNDNCY